MKKIKQLDSFICLNNNKITDTLYLIARYGISGGTGTLSLRVLKELKENNYNCAYFLCENNDDSTYRLMKEYVEILYCYDDISYKKHFLQLDRRYKQIIVLTYSIDEYIAISKIRETDKRIVRVLYYDVHCYAFNVLRKDKNLFLYLSYFIVNLLKYRALIKNLYRNKSILFMDTMSVNNTARGLWLKFENPLIFHLPFKINREELPKTKNRPLTIGTMCRMEFPFKGYVMGLLDEFEELHRKYKINLLIVGSGPNDNELKDKISILPHFLQSYITYIPSVPYNEMRFFYKNCDLYIGMGTTLIDAAVNNTLAIAVRAYTMELLLNHHFFYKNVEVLEAGNANNRLEDIIIQYIKIKQNGLQQVLDEQYNNVDKLYSISNFIKMFTQSDVGSKLYKLRKYSFYYLMKKVRHICLLLFSNFNILINYYK